METAKQSVDQMFSHQRKHKRQLNQVTGYPTKVFCVEIRDR